MLGTIVLLFAPTLPRLASHWLRFFTKRGSSVSYDEESAMIVVDGSQRIMLSNMLADLQAASVFGRWTLLRRQTLTLRSPPEMPTTLEEALPRLFPRVNDRMFYEALRLMEGAAEIPYELISTHLGVGLVVDRRDSVMHVTTSTLESWGRTLEKLLPVARANLLAHTLDTHFEEVAPGVLRSAHRDDYDDARVLLGPMLAKLPVAGDKLVCVANRNALFVTGSEVPRGLETLLALTEAAMSDESRPTNARIYRLDGFDLVELDGDTPIALHQRRVGAHARDTAEQKALLERVLEAEGSDRFVAALKVYERDAGPTWVTGTSWTAGCAALLPEADEVAFVTDVDAPTPTVTVVPWAIVQEVCGELLETTDDYPTRYRTLGFPSAAQLETMRAPSPKP